MHRQRRNETRIQRIKLIIAVAWIAMISIACRSEEKPKTTPVIANVAASDETVGTGSPLSENTSNTVVSAESKPVPSTIGVINGLRAKIDSAQDNFGERIPARRSLIYQLSRKGETDLAMIEFEGFLEDIEDHEGESKARMAARYLAQLLRARNHPLATKIYENMIARWPDSNSTPEYLHTLGTAYNQAERYAEAVAVFQRLVEEHDESFFARLGWQGLASAQRSLEDTEAALATLNVIIAKYEGTDVALRAAVSKGDVLTAVGRLQEARAAYAAFLSENRPGKYHPEAQRKLEQLTNGSIAHADLSTPLDRGDVKKRSQ